MKRIEESHKIGASGWSHTYKKGITDAQAARLVCTHVVNRLSQMGLGEQGVSYSPQGMAMPRQDVYWHTMFCVKWVDGACRILDTDEKYFSAMAQTGMHKESLEDLHIPWPAFAVRIPRGLIISEEGYEYTVALFLQVQNIESWGPDGEQIAPITPVASFYMICGDDHPCTLWRYEPISLADLLFEPQWRRGGNDHLLDGHEHTESDHRIIDLVLRGTAGLLYTLEHTNNFRFGGPFSGAPKSKLRGSPPPHRSIIIGRPLSVDVSESVRSDARGGGASPSVQTLVRGHTKRQVIGAGGKLRKVIWVEPYWRGPEDAPILARPHMVKA